MSFKIEKLAEDKINVLINNVRFFSIKYLVENYEKTSEKNEKNEKKETHFTTLNVNMTQNELREFLLNFEKTSESLVSSKLYSSKKNEGIVAPSRDKEDKIRENAYTIFASCFKKLPFYKDVEFKEKEEDEEKILNSLWICELNFRKRDNRWFCSLNKAVFEKELETPTKLWDDFKEKVEEEKVLAGSEVEIIDDNRDDLPF